MLNAVMNMVPQWDAGGSALSFGFLPPGKSNSVILSVKSSSHIGHNHTNTSFLTAENHNDNPISNPNALKLIGPVASYYPIAKPAYSRLHAVNVSRISSFLDSGIGAGAVGSRASAGTKGRHKTAFGEGYCID